MRKTALVVPCFNEARRLKPEAFVDFLTIHDDFSLFFVNDGSMDDTGKLLDQLAGKHPRIQVAHMPRNQGKAEASRQGLLQALEVHPEFIGFVDADLATPLAEIAQMVVFIEGNPIFQMVMASRVMLLGRDISRHMWRHYLGRVFATFVSMTLNSPVYDTQCGAKIFRVNEQLRRIVSDKFSSRWIFDVEILARISREWGVGGKSLGKVVFEYPIMAWHDVDGSKVRAKDFFRAVFELFAIGSKYREYLLKP